MGFLRTLFALTVVLGHTPAGLVFVGGRNAVQLFYVISGFLISYVITEAKSYSSVKSFYLSRYLRLYPVYLVVASLSILAHALAHPQFFTLYKNIPTAGDYLLILSNLFLFGQDWVMFTAIKNDQLLFLTNFNVSEYALHTGLLVPQAWTLGVELCFYLIAPFVLKSRAKLFTLLLCSLLLRAILIVNGIGLVDPWTFRFFPTELGLFILGALSHQILFPYYKGFFSAPQLLKSSRIATLLLFAMSSVYFLIPVTQMFKAMVLFAIFIPLLPLTFVFQNSSKLDKYIGELSYPLYIGHVLVINVAGYLFGKLRFEKGALYVVTCVVASLFLAAFLNHSVARNVELFRQRFKAR